MRHLSRQHLSLSFLGQAALAALVFLPGALHAQWSPCPNGVCLSPITDRVGIGTNAPVSPLHVEKAISVSNEAAQTITFSDATDSILAVGLDVNATPLQDKGSQIGVWAKTAVNGPVQKGSAEGRLGQVGSFFAAGEYTGVFGVSMPTELSTFPVATPPGKTSVATGGRFILNASGSPLNLTNGTNGTIWVGGVYGEVGGTINNVSGSSPNPGAVAAVIGIDKAAGSATHWAGYFSGRSFFSRNISVGLPPTSPATQMVDVQGTARLRNMPTGRGKIVVVLPDGTLARSNKNAIREEPEFEALLTRNEDLERRVASLESLVRSLLTQQK